MISERKTMKQTAIQTDKRDIVKEIIDYENQAYKELKSISDKRRKPDRTLKT